MIILVACWLGCVALCIFLSGIRLWGFELSEKVLIAFITSTTINVVGLFVVVAKWMYQPIPPRRFSPELPAAATERAKSKSGRSKAVVPKS
ncbi:MAG: hypothetical protein IT168_23900 [Bryobacterales bacterium]|nr:hypothetical protein [Bryobacterales bacterium]